MVVSAMKSGLFWVFSSEKEGKNSGSVVKLPWRESNSCVWLVFIEKLNYCCSSAQSSAHTHV